MSHLQGGDPEREAALHSAYLRRFPDVYTTCCHRRHCYRCHIKDFHNNLTCEEYQASKTTVEDVVPCPQCGLQLTKGDGCSSVNCLCGKLFNWDVELKKVHEALADAFARERASYGGGVDSVADLAVLINYHGGLPPDDSLTSSNGSTSSSGDNSGSASAEEEEDNANVQSHQSINKQATTYSSLSSTSQVSLQPSPPKAEIGMFVRASAWASLNKTALPPARSRLFEKMVNYQKKCVLIFSSYFLIYAYTNKLIFFQRIIIYIYTLKQHI